MLPIHTAAQVVNSMATSNASIEITWAKVAVVALVVVAICWLNRNNI